MTIEERLRSAIADECLAAIDDVPKQATIEIATLEALACCLGSERKLIQRRCAETFRTLHERGIQVYRVLGSTLRSDCARQRWGAAFALSLIGHPDADLLPVLIESLGAPDGDVRWAAADILQRLPDRSAAVRGLRALLRSPDPVQRKMAAYCLRDLHEPSAGLAQQVGALLDDPDAGVRLAALSCLMQVSADRASTAAAVLDCLQDPVAGVRRAAAAALGTLGVRSEPVIAALRAAVASDDASLHRAAERALRLLGE